MSVSVEVTVVTIDAGCSSGSGSTGAGTGDGGGTSGSGNTDTGSSGGGTGNNNTGNNPTPPEDDCYTIDSYGNCITIITKPISNLKFHSKSLKLQSDNIKIRNKINDLLDVVASTLEEDGAQFDLISAPLAPLDYNVINPIETGTTLTRFPDVRSNTEVNLHLHPRFGLFQDSDGAISTGQLSPIFSHGDLIFIGDFFEDVNGNNNISSILVSDEGVFALRVTDSDRANYVEDKLDKARHEKRFVKEFFTQVLTAPDDRPPYTNQEIIANFINFINSYKINDNDNDEGLGIILFQAEIDDNGNITGWTQKS